MNILYYFKEKDTFMDKWQRYHIFDELERQDCHITVYNPLHFDNIEQSNAKLIEFIRRSRFDLFMTPHNDTDLYIETLADVKKMGLPTLLICFDNLLVPFYHKNIARYFDLVWLTSKETESMFIRWGAKTVFQPYAANPYFFKPVQTSEIQRVVFVGSPYGSRANTINALTASQTGVSLYTGGTGGSTPDKGSTKGIQYVNPALDLLRYPIGRRILLGAIKQKVIQDKRIDTGNEYIELLPSVQMERLGEIYSGYALSLASTTARNTGILSKPVNVVNLRSFEIPMCGGLQICSFFLEMAEYFEEDKEIVFYRSREELIEKARFYLQEKNSELRRKMKKASRERSEKEHNWTRRFQKVYEKLDINHSWRNNG